jgi:hypothetical protein
MQSFNEALKVETLSTLKKSFNAAVYISLRIGAGRGSSAAGACGRVL